MVFLSADVPMDEKAGYPGLDSGRTIRCLSCSMRPASRRLFMARVTLTRWARHGLFPPTRRRLPPSRPPVQTSGSIMW